MYPAIFLDRDGVIIENRENYIRTWDDVEIFEQALKALVRIASSPYKIVIVTNQSAVGRGIISLQTAQEINQRLLDIIQKAGGRVDGIFICPHSPQDDCNCRKPRPGLILDAAHALSLELSRSILIGDALSDIQAGQNAGVGQTALVRTGRGSEQALKIAQTHLQPFPIYDTLSKALDYYLTDINSASDLRRPSD
jgi:D-glycero-D-manno-heptose 1,7-bisphosphate phosphatase